MRASSSARSPTCWDDSSTSRWWWPRRTVDGYRYRLLEPMRQYARERLVEAGEATTVEARHLAFYLELARAADPEGAAAGPLVALDRLEADHDNLRAALAWALRHEPEQALSAGRPHVADVDGRESLPGGQPLAGRGARGGPGADRAARGGAARGVRARVPPGADGRAQRAGRRAGRDLPCAGRPARRRPRARRGRGL